MTNIGVPNKNMSKKQGNTEYDTQNMKWKCAICGKLEKPPRLRKHGKTHMVAPRKEKKARHPKTPKNTAPANRIAKN